MEPGHHKLHRCLADADIGARKPLPIIANACLLVIALAGAALFVWWVLEFHPSNRQLWMVPLGLVMACTPVVMCLSVLASDAILRFELPSAMPGSPVAAPATGLEKGLKSNVCGMV